MGASPPGRHGLRRTRETKASVLEAYDDITVVS